jgi:hypothetical protein
MPIIIYPGLLLHPVARFYNRVKNENEMVSNFSGAGYTFDHCRFCFFDDGDSSPGRWRAWRRQRWRGRSWGRYGL